jgi:hypothetical protein
MSAISFERLDALSRPLESLDHAIAILAADLPEAWHTGMR